MDWVLLANIIVQNGLPVAEAIFTKWASGNPPTAADFAELKGLASQTAVDRAKARLTAAGIALDSPQAVQLLALVAQI